MTWFDDGGNKPPHEPPTQFEVEAMAAKMFGRKWKDYPQHQIAEWNAFITRHLDMARNAVKEEQ